MNDTPEALLLMHAKKLVENAVVLKDSKGDIYAFAVNPFNLIRLQNQVVNMTQATPATTKAAADE